jgi:hypothetical protein
VVALQLDRMGEVAEVAVIMGEEEACLLLLNPGGVPVTQEAQVVLPGQITYYLLTYLIQQEIMRGTV